MRASPLARASLLIAMALVPRPALAQAADQVQQIQQQIDQLRRDFGDRLADLERQLAALQGATPPAPAASPVPEPASIVLFGGGLSAAIPRLRRRNRRLTTWTFLRFCAGRQIDLGCHGGAPPPAA